MIIPSKFDGYGEGGRLTSTRRVYDSGGGGGGTQRVEQTNIPDYAQPYVEGMLGKGWAATDPGQNPYMQYQGDRTAQFTPLQKQSYNAAANMGVSPQIGAATGIAQNVANAAPGASNFNPASFSSANFTDPNIAGSYMNPYMQNVVDIQKREAMRQSDIMGQQQNAQAVGARAFGGSRHAIVEAERMRNLGQQMNDIQAQGANAAWQQAQQQFNADQGRGLQAQQMGEQSRQFGSNLGLQGLNTQLQAGTLMQGLGQNNYNQQLGIAGLQNQFGGQQQAQMQGILDNQYQDFQNYQAYPYKQLDIMSGLLRGLPLSQATTSLYEPAPSPLSQMAGLGTALYGMSRLKMAKGGEVSGYADGGDVEGAGLADLLISQIQ